VDLASSANRAILTRDARGRAIVRSRGRDPIDQFRRLSVRLGSSNSAEAAASAAPIRTGTWAISIREQMQRHDPSAIAIRLWQKPKHRFAGFAQAKINHVQWRNIMWSRTPLLVGLLVAGAMSLAQAAEPTATPSGITGEAQAALQNMGKTLSAETVSFKARTLRVYVGQSGDFLHIAHKTSRLRHDDPTG
jgi:hypothetical protein